MWCGNSWRHSGLSTTQARLNFMYALCLFVCLFERMMAHQGIPSRVLIARPWAVSCGVFAASLLSPLHHLWRCHVSLRPLHGSTAPLGSQPISSLLSLSSLSHLVTASISSLTSPASQRRSPTSFPALFVGEMSLT